MRKTFARGVAAATTMLSARRNTWLLHELSDAQLKDIGLTRFDVWHFAHSERRSLAD